MIMLKKLTFAPFFLLIFVLTIYQLAPFLKSYDQIFSLSQATLIQLITISGLILLSSLTFVLFATFASDWKFVTPLGLMSALIPFMFMPASGSLFFSVGLLICQILIFVSLQNSLKNYLTFNPNSLFGPPIRNMATFLTVTICVVYFTFINAQISQKGFQIPDSLLDTALNLTSGLEQTDKLEVTTPKLSISDEQLQQLRQNPDLLKQSGLDPKILDSLNQPQVSKAPQNLTREFTKQLVKEQVEKLIKPYLGIIAPALSILLFLTFQSLTSLLNLLIYPLLWIIFYILEKTGFVKFVVEQRPVKKMVI